MTDASPEILHVRITRADMVEDQLAGAAPRAQVVIVEVPPPGPSSADRARVAARLRSPELVSIGVARGTIEAAAAAALADCDFVVAGSDAVWVQAAVETVYGAGSTNLPPKAVERLSALPHPVTAVDMLVLGLVAEVAADPAQAAELLAAQLRAVAPLAIAGAKRMVDAAGEQTLDDALSLESELQTACLVSSDHRRIMAARSGPGGGAQA